MNQVSYFPYFPSGDKTDIKVNRVHFFNCVAFKNKYILDEGLRGKIEEICAMYVDENLHPLNSATIAVIDNEYGFNELSDTQIKDLQKYAVALMFCSFLENCENSRWVSEHFMIAHQRFGIKTDSISYRTGSYRRLVELEAMIKEKKFVKPEYISDSFLYLYDKKLFAAFANLIDAHDDKYEYLFDALEWVRCAFSNADGIRAEIRPVMLMTAFEILFQLPRGQKETEFATRLEKLLRVEEITTQDEDEKFKKGLPVILGKNARGTSHKNTIYGWWARDFYGLRSKIVHEGMIKRSDWFNHNDESHLEIALKVMGFCTYKVLEDAGYLVYEKFSDAQNFELEKFFAEARIRSEIEKSIERS